MTTPTLPDRPVPAELIRTLSESLTAFERLREEIGAYVTTVGLDRAQLLDIIDQLGGDGSPNVPIFGTSRPDRTDPELVVPAVRTYLAAGQRPTAWSMDSGLVRAARQTSEVVVLSWKDQPGAWLDQLLDTVPEHVTLYGCQNHEPFDNFATTAAIAEYHRRWDVAEQIMLDHGVIPTTILDGSHPESWDVFARSGPLVVNGVDKYNPGAAGGGTPREYVEPAEVYGPYFDWLGSNDETRALIGETGTSATPDDGFGSARSEWIASAREYLADAGVEIACWWNADRLILTHDDMALWCGDVA